MRGHERHLIVSMLLLSLLSYPASGATVGFKSAVTYPVGTDPSAVSIGDFNGDGKMDLAVADHGDPNANDDGGLSILLGNGDGTFQAAMNLVVAKNPCLSDNCLASTDFNGDGKLDLAIFNTDYTLSVVLGNGDGTFQSRVDYAIGGRSGRLGDVNGDQVPDLIVLRFLGTSVGILLGNGDGTFHPTNVATGSFPLTGLSVFDVDGDGKLDLVTAVGSRGIETLLGNGDGTFQPAILCSCGIGDGYWSAYNPTEGSDFNEDGRTDLAIMLFHSDVQHNSFTSKETVLLGDGDGTFQPHGDFVSTGLANLVAAIADLSQDGHSDIAIGFDGLTALFGNGHGSFIGSRFSTGLTTSIAAADISGDDFPDVIVTKYGLNAIQVLINTAQPVPVLTVTLAGNGSGNVTSSPVGIECPSHCLAPFDMGTAVSLTAAASAGSTFTGWSGACSGTSVCNVTMNIDQNVTATFTSPDFTLSATALVPPSVVAGQSAASTVTVTSVNGFNSVVSFTCAVDPLPAFAPTCALNPASVTPPANGSVSATLTVSTAAPTSSALSRPSGSFRLAYALWLPMAGLTWMGIGFTSSSTKKPRLLGLLLFSLLSTGLIGQVACGSGGDRTIQPLHGGTPPGQYTITVTGTSGSLQHSTQVMITVQ